eukprot:jgi/Chrzof1/13094/Cz07g19170.t1
MDDDDTVPYSQQAAWSDVTPVVVDDGGKVAAVQYDAEHKEALAYFRAILALGEKSERALRLTQHMIKLNSADYTAWQYRWECLTTLGSDLEAEYQFTRQIALENAKNYQLWNHRRKLAQALGPSAVARELAFAAEALELDEKNYHAWAHRQSVVAQGACWQEELQYSAYMIDKDVRNNSAWNQRFFVLQNTCKTQDLSTIIGQELQYIAAKVQSAPHNESAWNYLWGIFTLDGCSQWEMGKYKEVYTLCVEALADVPSCGPALDTLAQYYLCLASLCAAHGDKQRAKQAAGNASQVLAKAAVADPMRALYWKHRVDELQPMIQLSA